MMRFYQTQFYLYKIFLSLFWVCVSCATTVGFHSSSKLKSMDFGEEKTLRFCLYYDPEIPLERIDNMFQDLSEELSLYKLKVLITQKKEYKRKHFFSTDSLNLLMKEVLPYECDRILALFPRDFLDFLLAPFGEILGVVELNTRTRGLVYADYLTPNLILGLTPTQVLIHESYHLLGCDHNILMDRCYLRIQYAKNIKTSSKFFPSFGKDITIIFKSQDEVNQVLLGK